MLAKVPIRSPSHSKLGTHFEQNWVPMALGSSGTAREQLERDWKTGAGFRAAASSGPAHSERPPLQYEQFCTEKISSVSSTLYKTFWAAARAPSGRTTLGGEGREVFCA